MEKSTEMEQVLNEMSFGIFGRSRSVAIAGQGCVKCGKPATDFKDEVSRREFGITGFCQACQDEIFG